MWVDLDLRDVADVELVFARRPFTSALMHVADSAGALRVGLPGAWRREIHRGTRGHVPQLQLLRFVVPMTLTEEPFEESPSIDQKLAQLADAPDDPGLAEAAHRFEGRLSLAAHAMVENQRSFLTVVGRSIRDSAAVTREFWPRAAALLDREERRIDLARSPEARATLLANLVVGNRIDGHWLRGAESRGAQARLASRVELVPLLAGAPASFTGVEFDGENIVVVAIGYPLPGLGSLIDETGHALPEAPLDALLGAIRAEMLLALNRPLAMGELAHAIQLSPSRTTYHVEHLVKTGAIARRRDGSHVVVERTMLGDQLLNIFAR
jgi:DNA-binding transcriptional ArsR family regulator